MTTKKYLSKIVKGGQTIHMKDEEAHNTANNRDIEALFAGDTMPGDASAFTPASDAEVLDMMSEIEEG